MTTDNRAEPVLVITRVFHAPRELVFKAWTEARHLKHWWGPKGFNVGVAELDLRPGGICHFSMRSPDGIEMWGKFTYREIVAPERLVYTISFADAEGNTVRAPFSATFPLEYLNVLTFSEQDGKTTLTMQATPVATSEEERKTFESMFKSMQQGFGGTFDQLDAYLANAAAIADREIVLTRVFDAPRELVFKAWTDPVHVPKWWGPNGFTVTTHEIDVREGGVWRFIMHGPDGANYPNKIVYKEIVRPERLVYAHGGDGEGASDPFQVTVTFAEQAGKTHLTMQMLFATAAQREHVVGFGAIELGYQTLGRLADHLASM